MIELSRKVTLNRYIQVACLPPNQPVFYPRKGDQVWGVGFGQTSFNDSSNKVLRNAKFTVYEMVACKDLFSFIKKDNQKQVYA